jgi:hypothetical protein
MSCQDKMPYGCAVLLKIRKLAGNAIPVLLCVVLSIARHIPVSSRKSELRASRSQLMTERQKHLVGKNKKSLVDTTLLFMCKHSSHIYGETHSFYVLEMKKNVIAKRSSLQQ